MTVEQKIQNLIDINYPDISSQKDIIDSHLKITRSLNRLKATVSYTCGWRGEPEKDNELINQINQIIKESDEVECITSKFEYIRECKKWFMENKNE